jgi:hypothetical protein
MTNPIPKSAPSKREALQRLLADGKWHHMSELQKVGGARYGARLLELRELTQGLKHEHRAINGSDNEFEYRALFEGPQQSLPLAPTKKQRARQRIEELARENASLRARLAQLEGGATHG